MGFLTRRREGQIEKILLALAAGGGRVEYTGVEVMNTTGLSSGSMYPHLARLETEGLITRTREDRPDLPLTYRYVYALTDVGRARVKVLLSED